MYARRFMLGSSPSFLNSSFQSASFKAAAPLTEAAASTSNSWSTSTVACTAHISCNKRCPHQCKGRDLLGGLLRSLLDSECKVHVLHEQRLPLTSETTALATYLDRQTKVPSYKSLAGFPRESTAECESLLLWHIQDRGDHLKVLAKQQLGKEKLWEGHS